MCLSLSPQYKNSNKASSSSSSSSSDSSDDSDDDSKSTKESNVPADDGVPSKKRKAEEVLSNDNGYKKQQTGEEGGENTKIYIRGLPWRATEEEVRDFFASCGEMKSVELPLQDDGRSSGTGEVKFVLNGINEHVLLLFLLITGILNFDLSYLPHK